MKISIITPIYRGKKTLEKFIEAIRKQKSKNFEVILVVDTNNDDVLSVVDEEIRTNPRFKIVYNSKRTSRYEAISAGAEKATGEYSIILSPQNGFDENLVGKLIDIAETKHTDIIEFNAPFASPIKFSGKIRKKFDKPTLIEERPEAIALSYPFDFNKLFKTSVLVDTSKYKLPVSLNSRYSVDLVYLPFLVAKTYSTTSKNLVYSKSKLSDNFNPLKAIRQWEALHKLSNDYHSIDLAPVFTYAQYYSEAVFMSALIKSSKNKVLLKKFNDKFKKQQATIFDQVLETNRFMQMVPKEKSTLYKFTAPTDLPKLIKELD